MIFSSQTFDNLLLRTQQKEQPQDRGETYIAKDTTSPLVLWNYAETLCMLQNLKSQFKPSTTNIQQKCGTSKSTCIKKAGLYKTDMRFQIPIINNYWMRLCGISRIIEAEVGVICWSRRLRQITLTEASIIFDIPRKPNSVIISLFTWTTITKIMIL